MIFLGKLGEVFLKGEFPRKIEDLRKKGEYNVEGELEKKSSSEMGFEMLCVS